MAVVFYYVSATRHQFSGAREAVARLFALAQALTNDYEQFETIVSGGGAST